MHFITLLINGMTVKKRNKDIEAAIMSARPELVVCEMYITVKKGKNVVERRLPLVQARKLFNDSVYREIFINNIKYAL